MLFLVNGNRKEAMKGTREIVRKRAGGKKKLSPREGFVRAFKSEWRHAITVTFCHYKVNIKILKVPRVECII